MVDPSMKYREKDNYSYSSSYTPPPSYNKNTDTSLNVVNNKTKSLKDLMGQTLTTLAEPPTLLLAVVAFFWDEYKKYKQLLELTQIVGTSNQLGISHLRTQLYSIFNENLATSDQKFWTLFCAIYGTIRQMYNIKIESVEKQLRAKHQGLVNYSIEQYVKEHVHKNLDQIMFPGATEIGGILDLVKDYTGYTDQEYNLVLQPTCFAQEKQVYTNKYLLVAQDPEQLYFINQQNKSEKVAIVNPELFKKTLRGFLPEHLAKDPKASGEISLDELQLGALMTNNGGHTPIQSQSIPVLR